MKVNNITVCMAVILILSIAMVSTAFAEEITEKYGFFDPVARSHYKKCLKIEGYNPDRLESVVEALDNPKPYVRSAALKYLGATQREKAVTIFAKMLDDPYVHCRCLAARLLAIFGQQNGLARMREDYLDLLPKIRQKMEALDSATELSWEEKVEARYGREFLSELRDVFKYAKVLSEFGDTTGYELAAKVAMSTGYAYTSQCKAVEILGEIWNMDASSRQAENRQPQVVLLTLAETAKSDSVLRTLRDVAIVHKDLEGGTALYEKLIRSPHVSEEFRAETRQQFEGYKKYRKYMDSLKHKQKDKK